MRSFTLDSTVHSERDLGLRILAPVSLPANTRGAEFLEIPGRDGALTIDGDWQDRELEITIGFDNPRQFKEKTLPALYLARRIELSTCPGFYYLITHINIDPLSRVLTSLWSTVVNFRLAPFDYHTGVAPLRVTQNTTLNNPGTYASRPVITVASSSGSLRFSINGAEIALEMKTSPITVDSALLETYANQGRTAMNQYMRGDYPLLLPGANTVKLLAGRPTLTIQPNWRNT